MNFWLKVAETYASRPLEEGPELEDPEHWIEHQDYTCSRCGAEAECEYAYDLYNTSGDCLAEK
ncbi:MAG: hypothetical protein ABFE07_29315 [Armatimonadia bacterium]